MAYLHRHFLIIILLMKLYSQCLQIRSQHLKTKQRKKVKGGKSMGSQCKSQFHLACTVAAAVLPLCRAGVLLLSPKSLCSQRGHLPCSSSLLLCNSCRLHAQIECVVGAAAFCPSAAQWGLFGEQTHSSIQSTQEQCAQYQSPHPGGALLQTAAAFGELGQLNCLVKYK